MNKQAEIPACVIMCSLDGSKSPLATPHLLPGEKKKSFKKLFSQNLESPVFLVPSSPTPLTLSHR